MKIFNKIKNYLYVKKVKKFYQEYERLLLPAALLFGLIVDSLTFQNINISTAFSLLTFYLLLSAATIAFVHGFKEKLLPDNKILETVYIVSPIIIQFTFGALLSAIFIFYFFSGTVMVSWPLFLLLLILMVANDAFRDYYLKTEVQLSVYYFILLLFLILIIPFIVNRIGPSVFILSGLISLVLFYLFIKLILSFSELVKIKQSKLAKIVLVIFAGMNLLYFTNIIPPIPLSVRDSGIYYSVDKTQEGYKVKQKKNKWHDYLIPGTDLEFNKNTKIYIYTAIFAPEQFKEKVIHEWQYYDPKQGWITMDELEFYILGGRKDGYRGYSFKQNLKEGSWRILIKTNSGKILKVTEFDLEKTDKEIKTKEILKK